MIGGILLGIGMFWGLGVFVRKTEWTRPQMLGILLCVSLLVRLLFVCFWQMPPASDFLYYFDTANQLAHVPIERWGEVGLHAYYTTQWPTLVPFILFEALVMKCFGADPLVFGWINAIASTISCLFIFDIGDKLRNRHVGFLASMFYALSPAVLFYLSVVNNQQVSLVLLLGALVIVTRMQEKHWFIQAVGAGILLALSQLLRPEMSVVLIAMPTTCCFLFLNRKRMSSYQRTLMQMVKVFLMMFVTYSLLLNGVDAWLLQNNLVERSIQESNLAYKLMVGLNAQSIGYWNETDALFFSQTPNEAWSVVLDRIQKPFSVLILWVQKLFINLFWYGNPFVIPDETLYPARYAFATHEVMGLTHGYMVSAMMCALLQMVRKIRAWNASRWQEAFVFWICAGYMGAFLLLETQMRYQMVTYPMLMFFAAQYFLEKAPKLHLYRENGKIVQNRRKELER